MIRLWSKGAGRFACSAGVTVTSLLVYLLACLLAYSLACLLIYLLACLLAC